SITVLCSPARRRTSCERDTPSGGFSNVISCGPAGSATSCSGVWPRRFPSMVTYAHGSAEMVRNAGLGFGAGLAAAGGGDSGDKIVRTFVLFSAGVGSGGGGAASALGAGSALGAAAATIGGGSVCDRRHTNAATPMPASATAATAIIGT